MQYPAPLVVFSHLRWDWVYQRPQHLLARLARTTRVFFIEEPIHDPAATQPYWELREVESNVTVCRPRTAHPEQGFHPAQFDDLRTLLAQLRAEQKLDQFVVWLYTPMAVTLAAELDPLAIVYDCMDELSTFRGAPPELVARESEVYELADVVFTGGPSLYHAKKARHDNVHCFPSSVDSAHFGQARQTGIEPVDQQKLPHPRLGFFGVIDERIDLPLLDAVARARPEWQIVMVGPVTKINPDDLPRHPNLHYFGQQPYAALPGFLSGWDVCLLPFALNEATRFISPTKTLEYMAAEKPIVSTPITDVVEPYGGIVEIAGTTEEFIAACERCLAEPETQRRQRSRAMRAVLAGTSWDRTASDMTRRIAEAVQRRQSRPSRSTPAASHRVNRAPHPVIIAGAGPTGLSAAYHAGPDALLLEARDSVGGWCRSIQVNGFTFDYAGHIMFSNDPYVHELYQKLLGDNVHWQDREAWIYSKNVFTRYPFQGALYGLPPEAIKDCIIGAIEARFGALHAEPKPAAPAPSACTLRRSGSTQDSPRTNGKSHSDGDTIDDCCADGVLESTAQLARKAGGNGQGNGDAAPRNFEDFIYRVWGRGIAEHFAIPYNRKLWAVPLDEMETSWLGGRVPLPDLEEMIDGALKPVPKPMGPNARFGYPLHGGFQALMDGFLPYVTDQVRLKAAVTHVSPTRHSVTINGRERRYYDHLISTMPLPLLIRAMGDEAPPHIRRAAEELRHVSVRCVHIGVGREKLTEKHWIYYPEDTVFHRIFVQGNASPHCNPPGGFGLTCEITYAPSKPLPCDGDDLIARCIEDCRRVGIIQPEDPIWATAQVDLPYAYVVYDHARARNVKLIRDWLLAHDIVLAGRYSEWEYYNSDHAFIAGKKAVEAVQSLREQTLLTTSTVAVSASASGKLAANKAARG